MIKDKIAWLVESFEGGNKTRFARKIGIKDGKSALVHDWINGRSKPKASYQSAICNAYGITVEWLNDDNAPAGGEALPRPPIPAGKTTAVTGTIDAEKLMELIHSLQQDSRDKAAVIAGLVESTNGLVTTTKTMAESNSDLAEATKTMAASNSGLAETTKTMAESNKSLADTNAKLGSWIEKRNI